MSANVPQLCKDAESAFSVQSAFIGVWREAAAYCMPIRKDVIGTPGMQSTPYTPDPKLHNSTAANSLNTLTTGMASWITPSSQEWFQWQPAPEVDTDSVRRWLLECTRRAMPHIEAAGFYAAATEFFMDAAATGTAAMLTEGKINGSKTALNFRVLEVGSYAIAQNGAKRVNRVWQRLTRTVAEAASEWGEDALPPKFKELAPEKRITQPEVFLVAVGERDEPGAEAGPKSMPWHVTVVHEASKHLVQDGGAWENPISVYRWMTVSGPSPWGVGPGVMALCDERGVNWLDLMMGTAVEKFVDPPLAAKDNISGTLDLRAGGVTVVSDLNDAPRPISEVGDIRFLDGFLTKKEKAIKDYFHTVLWEAFLGEDRTITATEARLKQGEKLDKFGPAFHRLVVEFLTPVLERVFMILLRDGYFSPPPPDAFVNTPSGPQFLFPKAVQQSRMALAMNLIASNQIRQLLADILPVAQVRPEVLDHIDFDAAVRLMGQESTALAQIIRPLSDVKAMQQQRQQEQMAMMAAQAAMQATAKGGQNVAAAA